MWILGKDILTDGADNVIKIVKFRDIIVDREFTKEVDRFDVIFNDIVLESYKSYEKAKKQLELIYKTIKTENDEISVKLENEVENE